MRWRIGLSLIFISLSFGLTHWPKTARPFLEIAYADNFYPALQSVFLALPSFSGFLLADALWVILPLLVLVRLVILWRKNIIRRWLTVLAESLLWAASLYLCFMLLWGLNYQREPLYDQLKTQGFTNTLSDGHFEFALQQTQTSINLLPEDFDFCTPQLPAFNPLRPSAFAHSAMSLANLSTAPARAVKPSAWSGVLTRLGVAGVYQFPTGEPSISRNVYPLAQPFVMTHEYSHWAGYAREYDADIISYWSLWLSPDPIWQYSAWLSWWMDISEPEHIAQQLPQALRISIQCYRQHNAKQPRWEIRKSFWRVYETNLKSQGVSEGLKSYTLGAGLALSSYQDWMFKKSRR